jgi:hypothetical protein
MTMENLRGDESQCLWCGKPIEPDSQGCVVIDEDKRCSTEDPEAYYDPAGRVVPRAYGHTVCLFESVQDARNEVLQDVKAWLEVGEALDVSVHEIRRRLAEARLLGPPAADR